MKMALQTQPELDIDPEWLLRSNNNNEQFLQHVTVYKMLYALY